MMMLFLNSCVHNLMDKTKETYISYLLKQVSDLADSRDTVDQERLTRHTVSQSGVYIKHMLFPLSCFSVIKERKKKTNNRKQKTIYFLFLFSTNKQLPK